MSATDSIDMLSCANCGKGDEDCHKLKKCGACLSVKYCSAECQKAHRPQHKQACKQRAAELYDEKLFADPPPPEECPICMLPLSHETNTSHFMTCCGKGVCIGCIHAMISENLCPFCRTPDATSNEEHIERVKKLTEKGNAEAFDMLAGYYAQGLGISQDNSKANDLWLKAGELGYAAAYFNLGCSNDKGLGVEMDKKKAKYYYELAAIGGNVLARYRLGVMEGWAGNHKRAIKHFILAARAGDKESLDMVKREFKIGFVTKDEFANTLRAYHERQKEMKSDARDKAALG